MTLKLALDYYQGKHGGLTRARLDADCRDSSTPLDRITIQRLAPSLSLDWQVDDLT